MYSAQQMSEGDQKGDEGVTDNYRKMKTLVIDADQVVRESFDDRDGLRCLERCLVHRNQDGLLRLHNNAAIGLE